MDDNNGDVQIQRVKMEFPSGNHRGTDIENVNQRNVGPQLEMSDTKIETKHSIPLYNLYTMKVKDEVNDPDPPFFSFTSVLKSETDIPHLDIQYFDHSSIIQRNLKSEPDDEEENCEDPLSGADSVPHGETPGTSFQVLKHKCVTAHKRTNSEEKSFECVTCGKRFAHTFSLTTHKRTHSGEKPFECETCGKSFAVNSNLTTHRKTHSGEKPFVCETCKKCFAHSSDLTKHRRTHSGEKPFECEICGKFFAHSSSLRTHRRSHSGEKPHECETCGKCFGRSSTLSIHKRSHSGKKSFECEICGKSFVRYAGLYKHRKTHSGEKSQTE